MKFQPKKNEKAQNKNLKKKEIENKPEKEHVRLNKYIASAGYCSRREADEHIKAGHVKVNGKVVTELGTKVKPEDTVLFESNIVKKERLVYVLMNKPKGIITSSKDEADRTTVLDLLKGRVKERVYPVGRLDKNTSGVLLLTNDGELTKQLTHPKYNKKKIYHVFLDKNLSSADMEKLTSGLELEDGEMHFDVISFVNNDSKNEVGVEIHSGRNRVVRRMFEALNYEVLKLDRVYFAGLTKKNLKRGEWRFLTEKEIVQLRMGSYQ